MTKPTREQIIDAYEALEALAATSRHEDKITRGLKHLVRRALPPKPQHTMAEVEWDDDVHYLAEAVATPSDNKVIMLWPSTIGCIAIIEDGIFGSVSSDTLTPTGRRYTLTEVQE